MKYFEKIQLVSFIFIIFAVVLHKKHLQKIYTMMLRQLNDIIGYIYKVLVGLFLLLSPCDSWAQTAYQLPVFTSMRISYVRSLLQDKYGYVGMATMSGLGRYDGYQMELIKPTWKGNRQLLQCGLSPRYLVSFYQSCYLEGYEKIWQEF